MKVRTRTYVDSHQCFIEVKTRGSRGTTVKSRIPHRPDERGVVEPALAFVTQTLLAHGIRDRLRRQARAIREAADAERAHRRQAEPEPDGEDPDDEEPDDEGPDRDGPDDEDPTGDGPDGEGQAVRRGRDEGGERPDAATVGGAR